MNYKLWTVARWPSGAWETGGKPKDYPVECEVFQVMADGRDAAKKKAQRKRSCERSKSPLSQR